MAKAMTWRQALDVLGHATGGYNVREDRLWLVLPGRPIPVSNRTWGHWAAKAARVGMRRRLVAAAAARVRAALDVAPATEQASVRFVVYCTAPLPDYPNLAQNLKPDLDGLVDAGWLVDDDPRWLPCSPVYELVKVLTRAEQCVQAEVRQLS
jgi:hypothetical protein